MSYQSAGLAAGRWRQLTFLEQMANIGSEVERALNWRARLSLARHLAERGQAAEGLELLFDAVAVNPHALGIHQAIWSLLSQLDLPRAVVTRYSELTRDAIFYLDPHVCVRCRYRSTELLWQCPQCHEWNTFVEERLSPAKDEDLGDPITH